MLEQSKRDTTAQLCATIEEELGAIRQFADLPSAELEEVATRIARAILPLLGQAVTPASRAA